MDWARAKTLLIILLFAVNIFLFGTYMTRENADREEKERLRREVCNVLASQQINISEKDIPADSVKIRHATIRVREDVKKIAQSLLGEVTETSGRDDITYMGDKGNMMFFGNSFSLVYEAGREITGEEEARALAKEVITKLNVTTDEKKISCVSSLGGYTVAVPQVFGGVTVYGANVEFLISSSGNVLGNGSFIGNGRLVRAEGNTMNVSALLLEFADTVKTLGKESVNISQTEYGYMPKTPAGGAVHLVPTLKLVTDDGAFYVNMSDGKLVEI